MSEKCKNCCKAIITGSSTYDIFLNTSFKVSSVVLWKYLSVFSQFLSILQKGPHFSKKHLPLDVKLSSLSKKIHHFTKMSQFSSAFQEVFLSFSVFIWSQCTCRHSDLRWTKPLSTFVLLHVRKGTFVSMNGSANSPASVWSQW